MNYPVDITSCSNAGACKEPISVPEPTMADIMKEVSFLAEQNHLLVHRIRAFMTGESEDQNEQNHEPRHFLEELLKARYETHCANDELGKLAVVLGLH